MRQARAISHTTHVTNGSLAVVIVAHIDTGPLWYQWIARAGHHAWLWYGSDPQPGIERLVRETSPDVLVVDAPTLDDAAWRTVQSIRGRFGHARLRILAEIGRAHV